MDANGVLSAICFPQFVRFCGQIFTELGTDRDQAKAMVQAYNDWHIDEWAGTYPGRIIPLAIPMLWDAEACAAEIRRVAAKGCHAMTFSASPYALGLPSIHTDYWDPVWKAAVDENVVIAMHLGSSSQQPVTSPDAPVEVVHTLTPITVYETATDIVWSKMFHKFPDLRVSLTEGGIGWIPYFLERIDYLYSYTKYFSGTDLGGKLPSEIFNEHVYLCFVVDGHGLESLHRMNIDNVMWECDYPHSTNTWPHSPEVALKYMGDLLDDDQINKITWQNANRAYSWDPFVHIPKDQATVGALRQRAIGWDVSERSTIHLRPEGALRLDKSTPITIGTMAAPSSQQMKM
jgi:predicted TIM-barrel fold metal-dependent hydrolase